MCGRFVSATPPSQLARYFGAVLGSDAIGSDAIGSGGVGPDGGNFNVAPTQPVWVVYEDGGGRALDLFHWGLVPSWAKDPRIGSRMINARAETVAEKSSFRRPFASRRCLIPADGFYEWKKIPGQKKKQPMYLSRVDGEPFAFAGLWEVWRDKFQTAADGEPLSLFSCTIITGEANEKVAKVHDRMPIMLSADGWETWLDPDNHDTHQLQGLLQSAPASAPPIAMHCVSTDVNNVHHNGSHLIHETAGLVSP